MDLHRSKNMNTWSLKAFLLLVTFCLTLYQAKGNFVSLTVEGGGSLVGEYCPGTVRLFCEGVELTNLRLQYNDNIEIISYFPDSVPSIENSLSNPAFVSVSLTGVSKKLLVANYSVYLTADLFELQAQNIRSISCGNLDAISIEAVNVTTIPEQVPDTPHITGVNAIYQSGFLCMLDVTWNKTKDVCDVYASSLHYKVALNGLNSTQQVNINYSSCGEESCIASVMNILQLSSMYAITLVAFNSAGTSEPEVYLIDIETFRLQGSLPTIMGNISSESDSCLIVGHCNITCMVQYTTDSTYKNFSDNVIFTNAQFNISGLLPNTNYYFELSFFKIPGFLVTNRVQLTTPEQGLCNMNEYDPNSVVAILVPIVSVVTVIVCICVVIVLACICKEKSCLVMDPEVYSLSNMNGKEINSQVPPDTPDTETEFRKQNLESRLQKFKKRLQQLCSGSKHEVVHIASID